MAHLTKIKISNDNWDKSDFNLIVVGVYQDKTLTPMAKSIDEKKAISMKILSTENDGYNFEFSIVGSSENFIRGKAIKID